MGGTHQKRKERRRKPPSVRMANMATVTRREVHAREACNAIRRFAFALQQFCFHIHHEDRCAREFREHLKKQTLLPRLDTRDEGLSFAILWAARALACVQWSERFTIIPTSHPEGKARQAQRRMARAFEDLDAAVKAMETKVRREETMGRLGNGRIANKQRRSGWA